MYTYNLDDMVNRIKEKKKEKCLTNSQLAVLSNVPSGTLAKILGSETKDPQISNIIKISKALNISADYIIFGITNNPISQSEPLTPSEQTLLDSFRELNEDGQEKLIDYAEDLVSSNRYKKHSQSTSLSKKQA